MKFKLRKFRRGDENSLMKNINDSTIARNTLRIPHPYTRREAVKWINHNIKLQKSKKPKELNFVIDIDSEVAGGIGLSSINHKHNNAEIGYWLARKYWGKGVMTNAVKQLTRYGFKKLKLKRIYAHVFIFNKASKRVLGKSGFKFEGILRKHAQKKGKYYDSMLFAKIN